MHALTRYVLETALDPTDTIIIRSTIELAHELGLTVTAEGVEDEETLRRLRLLGADSVQGNLVCRPLPPGALARWIRETRRPLTAPAP